jgi:hypothetical protein
LFAVLHKCEILFFLLREKDTLRVFVERGLRGKFGARKPEILQTEEFVVIARYQ